MMRLTVLGGSAASPNPGMGCAGFLLETATTRIVLDLGPGTLPELRRHANFRALDGIVITHMHVDHMLDLLALRHALAYNPVPPAAATPVWLPPDGAATLAGAVAPFDAHDAPGVFAQTVHVAEYDPAATLAIGDLRLTFAPTVHYIPCHAIRVSDDRGVAIGYTGDTGPTAPLAGFFAGVALLIAESTHLDPAPAPPAATPRGSLTAREAGQLAAAAHAGRLLLSHIWDEHGAARQAAAAAQTFAGQIDVATPGWSIEL